MSLKEYIRDYLYEKVGILIDRLGSLVLFVLAMKYLTPYEFGKLSLLFTVSVAFTASIFAGPSMDIAREKDKKLGIEKLNCYLTTTILLVLIVETLVFILLKFIFGKELNLINLIEMLLFSLGTLFLAFSVSFMLFLENFKKEGLIYALRGILRVIFLLWLTPIYKILGISLAYFLSAFIPSLYLLKIYRPKLCNIVRNYLQTLYLNMFPLFLTVNVFLDQTIISKLIGFEKTGIYNIIDKIAQQFRNLDLRGIIIGKGKSRDIKKHWKTLRKLLVMYLLAFVLLLTIFYPILKLIIPLINPKYEIVLKYYYLVYPLVLVYVGNVFTPMLITYKLEKYLIPILTISIIVNLVGDLILVPLLGISGAIYSTILSQLLFLGGSYIITKIKLRI